ncbi:DUF4183 domain-containing protein [Sporolactobacillus sp. STCC-11]|uniref:DUF4183 domain-containing protein n=1 Tax=Sporolactobacillus caesalpiniae TaxID=3230362 RepID=UPI003399C610
MTDFFDRPDDYSLRKRKEVPDRRIQKTKLHSEKRDINTNTNSNGVNQTITINCSGSVPVPGSVLKAETTYYIATGVEGKQTYTNTDGLAQYGSQDIPDPERVSYFNLFVNGMLQPSTFYKVSAGSLAITGPNDVLTTGAPIVLQSIKIESA